MKVKLKFEDILAIIVYTQVLSVFYSIEDV
jgi:hypothetical protein